MILPRIGKVKNATSCRSEKRFDELKEAELPPCASERASFMADHSFTRIARHPYAEFSAKHKHFDATQFEHAPYSAAAIPFYWMLRKSVQGDEKAWDIAARQGLAETLSLRYDPGVEPELDFPTGWIQSKQNQLVLLDTFFSAIRKQTSLCFFYAKRTPYSDDQRRVLIGVGRVTDVGKVVPYKYKNKPSDGLEGVLWERNVHHSIRPNGDDGFLFPYAELAAEAARKGAELESKHLCFAPDEAHEEFSFGTAHVSLDSAVAALLACASTFRSLENEFERSFASELQWIDRELSRLWQMRGPYPGLGAVLTAFGIGHGTLLAYELALAQARPGSGLLSDNYISPRDDN